VIAERIIRLTRLEVTVAYQRNKKFDIVDDKEMYELKEFWYGESVNRVKKYGIAVMMTVNIQ
jgi:hypothetical protein